MGLLHLQSCMQQQVPEESPHSTASEIVLWLSAESLQPSAWADDIRSAADSLPRLKCLACFSNHLDSTKVYAILSSNDGKVPESLCNKAGATCDAFVESTEIEPDLGHGPYYLFVSHSVQDPAEWNTSFMSMFTYKESDSIYTIGVLSGQTDSLHVAVISRTPDLRSAADYADMLESKGILRKAGVSERKTSMVLRRI